jgi:hypothetical protein
MKIHELKTISSFFECVADGRKPFEIRKNDRNFKVGDVLLLREIEPTHSGQNETYTGRMKAVKVTYMTDWNQRPGYVVMGISII